MIDALEPERYRLSFTSGALHRSGAATAAALYGELADWGRVRAALRADNLLHTRSERSSVIATRELVERLATLTDDEIGVLVDATHDELVQLLWAAACRRYDLIGEFAEEVLRERFLLLHARITFEDFDTFVGNKKLWHSELAELTSSTYRKLRSNLFAMLREADLVAKDGAIVPTVLAVRVRELLTARMPSDIRFFPTREAI